MLDQAKSEHAREIPDPQAPVDPDASIGELVGRIVDDARELVDAEVALAKAKARVEMVRYKTSVILFGIAAVFATAALVAFAVGLTIALSALIGPWLGGLVSTGIFAVIAGILAWLGARRLEQQ